MSKVRLRDLHTSAEFQKIGNSYYRQAVYMEERGEAQSRIDGCWKIVAINYWKAFCVGGEEAPISLFKCFGQGIGVEKNLYVATLMYRVALKFTPEQCAAIIAKVQNKDELLVTDNSMKAMVEKLVKLIQLAQSSVPEQGVPMQKVAELMHKFNNEITLPEGNTIESLLTDRHISADNNDQPSTASASTNQVVVNKKVSILTTIQKHTANMPQEGVDDAAFNSLLLKCNDEIVGITGKRIPDCFNKNTPAASTTHASSILPSGSGTSYMITDRERTQKLWTKLGNVPPHKLAYSATILAEAEEAFAEARSLLKGQKASESPLARIKLKETIDKLISALALGEQDAAEYLTGIGYHYPDYEIEKNEKFTQLLAIGEILESTVPLPLINSEKYITIDKVDELKTHPNYPEAVKLAKEYTAVIINNQNKYINKQEIPVEKLQEPVTRFKEAAPSQIIKHFNLQISARAATNTVENDLEEHIEVPVDPVALNHLLLVADQQQDVASIGVESSSWCSCCSGCVIM